MKKNEKTQGKLQFFFFLKIAIFLVFFFFIFFIFSLFYHFSSFFISFHQFHHWKQKWLKNDKKMKKKTRGKLHFFIFRKIVAPLEAKMVKNVKKWKKWKKLRDNCNFSFFWKLQFSSSFFFICFIFFSFFYCPAGTCTLGRPQTYWCVRQWQHGSIPGAGRSWGEHEKLVPQHVKYPWQGTQKLTCINHYRLGDGAATTIVLYCKSGWYTRWWVPHPVLCIVL